MQKLFQQLFDRLKEDGLIVDIRTDEGWLRCVDEITTEPIKEKDGLYHFVVDKDVLDVSWSMQLYPERYAALARRLKGNEPAFERWLDDHHVYVMEGGIDAPSIQDALCNEYSAEELNLLWRGSEPWPWHERMEALRQRMQDDMAHPA